MKGSVVIQSDYSRICPAGIAGGISRDLSKRRHNLRDRVNDRGIALHSIHSLAHQYISSLNYERLWALPRN